MLDTLTLSKLNLAFQMVILVLLVVGFFWARRGLRLRVHGTILLLATAINTASILLWMLPMFLSGLTGVERYPFLAPSYVMVIHHSVGLIVEVLALFLVLKWAVGALKIETCPGYRPWGRKVMIVTFALWIVTIVMGVSLYVLRYVG